MRLVRLGILGLLFVPALLVASSSSLTFKRRGKVVATHDAAALEKLVPAAPVKVFEPHENQEVGYRGWPASALLDAIYHDDWKQEEEVLFTCSDGYQPSVPVSQFKTFSGFLVDSRQGAPKFDLAYQGRRIDLGPYYLVWDNLKSPELKAQGMNDWPYQVVSVDLIRFADRFPRMAPPPGASAEARAGFTVFRKQCQACHSINGEGGTRGIELNYPVSVTEYFDKGWLRKWIESPASLRYGTRMPGINRELPGWKKDLDAVLEYLKAMAGNKKKPAAS